MPVLPDLITLDYATLALAIYPLNAAQTAFLPSAITAASAAIRRYCGDRDFTQLTYTKDFAVIQGQVRLDQFPVNQIIRAQSQPTNALTISNGSAQTAQALFTYTGTSWLGQTATGITLNWTTNGTPSTTSVAFVPNMVLNDLVTLINAVGNGWNASLNGQFGNWAVTELVGGYLAKGAIAGGGAIFQVFNVDLTGACYFQDNGQLQGMVNVGNQYSDGIGPRWGPDFAYWSAPVQTNNIVRMTYNSGFAVIPADLQEATVETVKAILVRLLLDPFFQSETADRYSYAQDLKMIRGLHQWVRDILSTYRIHNA